MVIISWWVIVLVIVLVCGAIVGILASSTATRLNRMHVRTDLARNSLEAALGRRAAIARVAFPELGAQIAAAESIPILAGEPYARADAENDISRALSELWNRRKINQSVEIELYDVHTRLELARRFYNDAVTATQALRRRPIVRILRLSGTAVKPEYFDMSEGVFPDADR